MIVLIEEGGWSDLQLVTFQEALSESDRSLLENLRKEYPEGKERTSSLLDPLMMDEGEGGLAVVERDGNTEHWTCFAFRAGDGNRCWQSLRKQAQPRGKTDFPEVIELRKRLELDDP